MGTEVTLSRYEACRYASLDLISLREFLRYHELPDGDHINLAAFDAALDKSKRVLGMWACAHESYVGVSISLRSLLIEHSARRRFHRWRKPRPAHF